MNCDNGHIYTPEMMKRMESLFAQMPQEQVTANIPDPPKIIPMEIPPTEKQLNRKPPKVGRNEPCPCGSGLKFKKCHLTLNYRSTDRRLISKSEGEVMDIIEKLEDLHKQATVERSHYYVGSVCREAAREIDRLKSLNAALVAALKKYHAANPIHNDSEFELWEVGEAAIKSVEG